VKSEEKLSLTGANGVNGEMFSVSSVVSCKKVMKVGSREMRERQVEYWINGTMEQWNN
jgi:hypothetical protein